MNTKPENKDGLAEKIEATDNKLHLLEKELEAFGEPAYEALHDRLEAIKIEEHALQRNFAEIRQSEAPDESRTRKVEALLHHIEAEEAELEHDAEFLHHGAPSTLNLAYRIGSYFLNLGAFGAKKIFRGHHLLWHSPFVNTTGERLASRFHLPRADEASHSGKN